MTHCKLWPVAVRRALMMAHSLVHGRRNAMLIPIMFQTECGTTRRNLCPIRLSVAQHFGHINFIVSHRCSSYRCQELSEPCIPEARWGGPWPPPWIPTAVSRRDLILRSKFGVLYSRRTIKFIITDEFVPKCELIL